ncbi:MAG: M20/M25/M40 family metallo-hydrolase [Limnochordales bacterium]
MDYVDQAWQSPVYRRMDQWIADHEGELIQEVIDVCQVPAPPFQEGERAQKVAAGFRQAGLTDVAIDQEGNVVAVYPGRGAADRLVVVSAHLDTVFPAGTDVGVRREGERLYAPGISDNSAAVAALLFLARGLVAAGFEPEPSVVFLANVGEEGLGNLRGMRHFFQHGLGARRPVAAALVLDGRLGVMSTEAVGSRRLAVTYRGPGGHSWADFGRPSAIHALGRAIAAIAGLAVPAEPKTTFNVGTVTGGTAVNAIAQQAAMVVDMRSVDGAALARLEEAVRAAIADAARAEGGGEVDIQVVGERPAGRLDPHHPLRQLALGAATRLGLAAEEEAMSTDANIPLSLGIPAVVLGIAEGGGMHTLEEWLAPGSLGIGVRSALLSLLSAERWAAQTT